MKRGAADWLSVAQFALSLIALCLIWGMALLAVFFAFLQSSAAFGGLAGSLPLLMTAASALIGGILLLPSVVTSLQRIAGRPPGSQVRFSHRRWPSLLIFALPVVLLLGNIAADQGRLALLFLPPLNVLAVLLPVVWLLYLAVRGLPLGTQQRAWGIFDSGLVLGPALIILAEIFAALVMLIAGVLYIAQNPQLIQDLSNLSQELTTTMPSTDRVVRLMAPYLTSPLTIAAVIGFFSLIVPLAEEALKPIGVWLLAGRKLSPAAGFAGGALSGAGFAIFESLTASTSGEQWTMLVVGRIGTAVVHILTTALMGLAIVNAWNRRRYLRLAATYLGVVLLHGAWNALSILYAIDGMVTGLDLAGGLQLPAFISATPFILAVFSALLFAALLWSNRRLYRSHPLSTSAQEQGSSPAQLSGSQDQGVL